MKKNYITSRSNDKIKYVSKLVSSSKQRNSDGLFVCEGLRLCCDASKSGYDVSELYITEDAFLKNGDRIAECFSSSDVYIITDEIADKLSDTVNSQGIFAVVKIPAKKDFALEKGKYYVLLENVQNPQNTGAVSRTAEALGIDALITVGGCDIYNPKLLRASMGSVLRIPVFGCESVSNILNQANGKGIFTFVTVPDRSAEDITKADFSQGALAVIGNEANGVSDEAKKCSSAALTIKMNGEAESLNASTAAVITMWEMMR